MRRRVAMVGLGAISRFYLRALERSSDFELAAVCDLEPSRLEPLGARGVACDLDFERTFARDDLDAIIVNLPNDLHAHACTLALESGKHVCCEKPLALDVPSAEAMAACARAAGRTLFTAFHRRYNSNLVALRDQIAGAPVARARARYHELIADHVGDDAWYLDPARCGGGCLADNGPNAFDELLFLLGPLEVRSSELRRDARGVDLQARVLLETDDGVEASVELDWDYGEGELKDVTVWLADGSRAHADMLEGFTGFKQSLEHEYEGVLAGFAAAIASDRERGEHGLELVRLVARAYEIERERTPEGSAT